MKKTKKGFEAIKTLLIALLFLIIILMACLHFEALRSRNENASGTEETDFTLKSTFSSSFESLTDAALLPCEIAYKDNKLNTYAITAGRDYMQEIYSLLDMNIAFMLGNGCKAEEETAEAFDNAVDSENFIYIRYHSSIPAVLAYIHSFESNKIPQTLPIGEKTPSLSLSELIIFPENTEKGSVFALARSSFGDVTKFISQNEPETKIVGVGDLEIYREAGAMVSAKFYNGREDSGIMGATLILDDLPFRAKIGFYMGIEGLSENSELQAEFANILDINPNKTGSYFDSEIGGTVYMATHGTLTVTDGNIVYSTENYSGGIPLSFFSGKDAESHHSIYECLAAAQALASTFAEMENIDIGDAEMLITDLYRNDDILTVEFGYFYDNIPIADSETALKIMLSSDKLTGLEFYPANVTADMTEQQKSIPASWVIDIAESNISDNSDYTVIYKYIKNKNGKYTAEWIPVKINN
ncbi:MAG: hypothetical protein IJZ89_07650 [Clostridia bacterium]|nr:hypothetical protein [Clostridia bacterium]